MRRRKAWIFGTGIVYTILPLGAAFLFRPKPARPFDFLAVEPIRLIYRFRTLLTPRQHPKHPEDTRVYALSGSYEDFKAHIHDLWRKRGSSAGKWHEDGTSVMWDERKVGGGYIIVRPHTPSQWQHGKSSTDYGCLAFSDAANAYPPGTIGDFAERVTNGFDSPDRP